MQPFGLGSFGHGCTDSHAEQSAAGSLQPVTCVHTLARVRRVRFWARAGAAGASWSSSCPRICLPAPCAAPRIACVLASRGSAGAYTSSTTWSTCSRASTTCCTRRLTLSEPTPLSLTRSCLCRHHRTEERRVVEVLVVHLFICLCAWCPCQVFSCH